MAVKRVPEASAGVYTMNRVKLSAVLSAALVLCSLCVWPQQPEPLPRTQQPQQGERVPAPNGRYQTPEGRAGIAKTLDSATRAEEQKPEQLVSELGLKKGDRVADVGTGTGYILPYLSRAVGSDGVVYAEDIFSDFLDRARDKAKSEKLLNVRFVLGADRDPKLPASELDMALLLESYHHFEYPKTMLDNIRTALKPGGRLALVDYYKRGGMAEHERLD